MLESVTFTPFDLEIERTLKALRKKKVQAMENGQQNVQPRVLKDYVRLVVNDNYSGIRHQTVIANNVELKLALISMIQQSQFSKSPIDDPNIHLEMFLKICDIVKINGVTEDTIRLRLFLFSLRDKTLVDAVSGGTSMSKTPEGATSLLEISVLITQRIPQNADYVAATSRTDSSNEASQGQVQYINNWNYNYRGNPVP
ncbi:uncharacterized protein LOC131153816 [Malania oleifera]|uniref:uncharacterized protein LOC131153816 n=1 Tax=Malania oleifera TaxID=397392 RepID=UPI0025AEAAD3|nr:uncharacterized protein LOC131153816 [Malania oleifera]